MEYLIIGTPKAIKDASKKNIIEKLTSRFKNKHKFTFISADSSEVHALTGRDENLDHILYFCRKFNLD